MVDTEEEVFVLIVEYVHNYLDKVLFILFINVLIHMFIFRDILLVLIVKCVKLAITDPSEYCPTMKSRVFCVGVIQMAQRVMLKLIVLYFFEIKITILLYKYSYYFIFLHIRLYFFIPRFEY